MIKNWYFSFSEKEKRIYKRKSFVSFYFKIIIGIY